MLEDVGGGAKSGARASVESGEAFVLERTSNEIRPGKRRQNSNKRIHR